MQAKLTIDRIFAMVKYQKGFDCVWMGLFPAAV